MLAYCGRPAAASFCDPFAYIVTTMRAKRSQKSARCGSPSRRRSLVRQAPEAPEPSVQQLRAELRHGSTAELPHHAVRFRREDLHRAVNPRFSGRDESIKGCTAYPNCIRPQGERFHNVGSAPEALAL